MTDGWSVQGRPIAFKSYSVSGDQTQQPGRVLLIGGIHGDEYSSVSICFRWMEFLDQDPTNAFEWIVVPAANPDGLLQKKSQRQNARGVDLNRNFPTGDWNRLALAQWRSRSKENPRRYPGAYAASEPEVLWLLQQIREFQPDVVIAIHAPYDLLDYDGPPTAPQDKWLSRNKGLARQRLKGDGGAAGAGAAELPAAAGEVLLKNGHADDVVRLSLVPVEGRAQVVLSSRTRSPIRVVKLLPTILERPEDAPPADVKAEPRRYYDEVRQQAQDGEADDGIVVGMDGALLETSFGNLWLRLDGVWTTPALDGRVLPGVGRGVLLEEAAAASLPCEERRLSLADLHRAEAVAHGNAVHGPRAACLLGERAASELVEAELGALWERAWSV